MKYEKLKENFLSMAHKSRFPHCMIIQGGSNEEKEKLLDFLLKAILCQELKGELRPCGVCNSCKKLSHNRHPDVSRIYGEGKSNIISVDKVREIKENAYIIPTDSDYKVYIFYNAEDMTVQAQNAVLKLFEEPPASVVFILTSKNSESLLPTILSRAQLFVLDTDEKNSNDVENEALTLAKNIINDIIDNKKRDFFFDTAKCIKDKQFLKSVLEAMQSVLSDTLTSTLLKENQQNNTIDENIAVGLFEIMNDTKSKLQSNANVNLLMTDFCIKTEELIWS